MSLYSIELSFLFMIKRLLTLLSFSSFGAFAQCDSVTINNDLIVSSSTLMAGIYVIDGDFIVQNGATVYITPYSSNACGALKIYAKNITILGDIDGDFAGYPGGIGGAGGATVTSITGHQVALTSCTDTGNYGVLTVEGGKAGGNGNGPGGGVSGSNGQSGSGPKQYCGSFGDEGGMVGGAGGAGGGAGGSYGGVAGAGAAGGSGSAQTTLVGMTLSSAYPVAAGTGGTGGVAPTLYGTAQGFDIDLGSGGAGAGGGGRSFGLGLNGNRGGNGGGMIFLQAELDLTVSGILSVRGENGQSGGIGGNGDGTTDCCSDGCNGCDESTFSGGAGGGAGAGGGSGGGIYLETMGTANLSSDLRSNGGNGGNSGQQGNGTTCNYTNLFCSDNSITTGNGTAGQAGGAGSGGRIKIFVPRCEDLINTASANSVAGVGFGSAGDGTYEVVCGYAGLLENELLSVIQFYPNPVGSELHLRFPEELKNLQSTITTSIMDASGRIVFLDNLLTFEQNTIFMGNFETGYYIIRFETETSSFHSKLLKL
jgi:hypothetical protein